MKSDDIERLIRRRIEAGGEHMAGDGGYSLGTREGYEAFVALRNQSLDLKKSDAPAGRDLLEDGEKNADNG